MIYNVYVNKKRGALAVKGFLKKLSKALFWLCFSPYAFVLVMSIYHAVFGFESKAFGTGKLICAYYGTEAFLESATVYFLFLLYFGIIPACLIYQGAYLAVKFCLRDKKKNSE